MVSALKVEHNEAISKKSIETDKTITKLKQDYESKLIEFKQTYENKVKALELDHVQRFAAFKTDTEKKFYDKLKDEYADFQKHGDKNSKFVQELALEVMKKSPPSTTRHELEYTEKKGHHGR
jgi:hypothetical protein